MYKNWISAQKMKFQSKTNFFEQKMEINKLRLSSGRKMWKSWLLVGSRWDRKIYPRAGYGWIYWLVHWSMFLRFKSVLSHY